MEYKRAESCKTTPKTQILSALEGADKSPETLDALIEVWNTICSVDRRSGSVSFSDMERNAIEQMSSQSLQNDSIEMLPRMSQMLDHFEHSTFLVSPAGKIIVQNDAALREFDIGVGQSLNDLPLCLDASEPLTQAVVACLSGNDGALDTVLRSAFKDTGEVGATFAITPTSRDAQGNMQALVFVIDAQWTLSAPELITASYDLSKAEVALFQQFLQGHSLEDMAQLRGRSVATVRTQFYAMMTKMGVRNQTELLRLALSVVQMLDEVHEIATVLRHPHRKRIDMLRPAGRSVQVTLSGDLAGWPMVVLQSCLMHRFPYFVEEKFFNAGICCISMCRPGFGDTDPPPKGEDELETFATDLRALLDQMGHDKCAIVGPNLSACVLYKFAPYIADRVSVIVQASGCLPAPYAKRRRSSSTWAEGLIQAAVQQPNLKAFMVKSGIRAWRALGQRRFLKMQFFKHPKELEYILTTDHLDEVQDALETVTKQGFDRIARDVIETFDDYTPTIASCPVPVLVLHGDENHVFPITSVREMVADFAPNMRLVEVKGTGFTMFASDTDMILEQIARYNPKWNQTPRSAFG